MKTAEGDVCEKCGGVYGCDRTHVPCPWCEVERLVPIVDKLPKTADGVSVVPEQHIWWDGCGFRVWCVWGHSILLGEQLPGGRTVRIKVASKDCYSTHKAAEAAGGEHAA
jgi:hypothetical protein